MSANEPSAPVPQQPASVAIPAKRRSVPRWVTPVLALVAAIAIGLFGGIAIGHSTASGTTRAASLQGFRGGGAGVSTPGQGGSGARPGFGGGFSGGGFTSGTIVSVKGDTLVVKEANGSTVTVTAGSKTTVTKTAKSSVDTLKAGQTVTVIGKAGSNGSVTATSISEGQAGFGAGLRGRAARPTGAPSGQ